MPLRDSLGRILKPIMTMPRQRGRQKPLTIRGVKTGRNEPCPCASGKKFKKCCGRGKR